MCVIGDNNPDDRKVKSGKRLPDISELYSQNAQHSRNEKLLANALSVLSESMERKDGRGGSKKESSKEAKNDQR